MGKERLMLGNNEIEEKKFYLYKSFIFKKI